MHLFYILSTRSLKSLLLSLTFLYFSAGTAQDPSDDQDTSFSPTFISLYALQQQAVGYHKPLLFDGVSAQNGSVTWAEGGITVPDAGTYRISFGVQSTKHAKFSLRVNNANVRGGTLNLTTGSSNPFSGLTIDVAIPANAVITLINTGEDITLQNYHTDPTASRNPYLPPPSTDPDPDATIGFMEIHRIL